MFRRTATAVALAGCAALTAAPAQAQAAPESALACASYGGKQICLQRKPSDRRQRELVYRASPDAVPRLLDIDVPARNRRFSSDWAENLALGLDRRGRLTVVLQSRRGLYTSRVSGVPRLRRVPDTTRNDTFPSIFRGKLAYSRVIGETGSVVRLRSLDGRVRTVWSNLSDIHHTWVAVELAVGVGRSVAIVTARDGAGNGAYRALLARPGHRTRRLLTLGLGDDHVGGLGVEVSPSGRRLVMTRDFDDSTTQITYLLPGGSPRPTTIARSDAAWMRHATPAARRARRARGGRDAAGGRIREDCHLRCAGHGG